VILEPEISEKYTGTVDGLNKPLGPGYSRNNVAGIFSCTSVQNFITALVFSDFHVSDTDFNTVCTFTRKGSLAEIFPDRRLILQAKVFSLK
jgi:hypothetical protein